MPRLADCVSQGGWFLLVMELLGVVTCAVHLAAGQAGSGALRCRFRTATNSLEVPAEYSHSEKTVSCLPDEQVLRELQQEGATMEVVRASDSCVMCASSSWDGSPASAQDHGSTEISVERATEASPREFCCATGLQGVVNDAESAPRLRCRFVGADTQVDCDARYAQDGGAISCKPNVELVKRLGANRRVQILQDDSVVHETTSETSPLKQSAGDPVIPSTAKEDAKRLRQERFNVLKPFVIISCSYLLFTITDGAVRLIVLLHAFNKHFTAMEVAILFTLYETAGVATNLVAGMVGSRWGIKRTLIIGLMMQLAGLGMLFGWQDSWTKLQAIIYVTFAQMLCGISKDLTKLGGKTVTKLVTPEEKQKRLFKLVSFITGFKNSLKGVGYFLGAALLAVSYYLSLSVMCGLIILALPWAVVGLDAQLGRSNKKSLRLTDVFKKNYNINVLSFARIFLFAARDLWFEVPLPFYLRSAYGFGWSRPAVGAYLAVWIILYGQIQSWTPQLFLKPLRQNPPNKWAAVLWCFILVTCPIYLGSFLQFSPIFEQDNQGGRIAAITAGVVCFAIIFAINSSIHSYLIVKYSEGDKVAMNVGFYYMSNAVGRLTGTLASGALYSYVGSTRTDGFAACFWVSLVSVVVSATIGIFLNDHDQGLPCGSFFLIKPSNRASDSSATQTEQRREVHA